MHRYSHKWNRSHSHDGGTTLGHSIHCIPYRFRSDDRGDVEQAA